MDIKEDLRKFDTKYNTEIVSKIIECHDEYIEQHIVGVTSESLEYYCFMVLLSSVAKDIEGEAKKELIEIVKKSKIILNPTRNVLGWVGETDSLDAEFNLLVNGLSYAQLLRNIPSLKDLVFGANSRIFEWLFGRTPISGSENKHYILNNFKDFLADNRDYQSHNILNQIRDQTGIEIEFQIAKDCISAKPMHRCIANKAREKGLKINDGEQVVYATQQTSVKYPLFGTVLHFDIRGIMDLIEGFINIGSQRSYDIELILVFLALVFLLKRFLKK